MLKLSFLLMAGLFAFNNTLAMRNVSRVWGNCGVAGLDACQISKIGTISYRTYDKDIFIMDTVSYQIPIVMNRTANIKDIGFHALGGIDGKALEEYLDHKEDLLVEKISTEANQFLTSSYYGAFFGNVLRAISLTPNLLSLYFSGGVRELDRVAIRDAYRTYDDPVYQRYLTQFLITHNSRLNLLRSIEFRDYNDAIMSEELIRRGISLLRIPSIEISGYGFTNQGAMMFGTVLTPDVKELILECNDNQLSDDGKSAIVRTTYNKLHKFSYESTEDSERTHQSAQFATALCDALKARDCSYTYLKLSGIDKPTFCAVVEGLKSNTTVTELCLRDNECVGNAGVKPLSEMLKVNRTLKKVRLTRNGIDDDSDVDQLLLGTFLKELDLSDNRIANSRKKLGDALKATEILEIDLSSNLIGTDGAKDIAEGLKENPKIEKLELGKMGYYYDDLCDEAYYDEDVEESEARTDALYKQARFDWPEVVGLLNAAKTATSLKSLGLRSIDNGEGMMFEICKDIQQAIDEALALTDLGARNDAIDRVIKLIESKVVAKANDTTEASDIEI